jgi:hypothetical protein
MQLHGQFDVMVMSDFRQQLDLLNEHAIGLPLMSNVFQ